MTDASAMPKRVWLSRATGTDMAFMDAIPTGGGTEYVRADTIPQPATAVPVDVGELRALLQSVVATVDQKNDGTWYFASGDPELLMSDILTTLDRTPAPDARVEALVEALRPFAEACPDNIPENFPGFAIEVNGEHVAGSESESARALMALYRARQALAAFKAPAS